MLSGAPMFQFRGPWGIPVEVGASLILLLLLLVDFTGAPQGLAFDLMFFAILVVSIYLHELGHAWGCLIQGIPVRRVVIYGGGGFCEYKGSPSFSEQELIVAMGPIVNLALWAIAGLIQTRIGDPEIAWVFATISWVNLMLAVFNLLPVMPLDGGRLFLLGLHRLLPPLVATRVAGAVGLGLCILWIPLMLMSFVYIGLALIALPAIGIHWRMLRYAEA